MEKSDILLMDKLSAINNHRFGNVTFFKCKNNSNEYLIYWKNLYPQQNVSQLILELL